MQDEFYHILAVGLQEVFQKSAIKRNDLQEIRLRAGRPLLIKIHSRERFLTMDGESTEDSQKALIVTAAVLKETLEYVSRYSLYAYEEELRQGFLTVKGGHRVGLSGQMVKERGGNGLIRNVQFLNIRVAHEVRDCALPLLPFVYQRKRFFNTLIVSSPGAGKTTMLRDLIRLISDGNSYGAGQTVGVVDERSELGACHLGVPQNDLGLRTDVLDGCKKSEGMLLLIRSMSPDIIAVDELGGREELEAVTYAATCGIGVAATVHGRSYAEILDKPGFREAFSRGLFERVILLSDQPVVGTLAAVTDGKGEVLWKSDSLEEY